MSLTIHTGRVNTRAPGVEEISPAAVESRALPLSATSAACPGWSSFVADALDDVVRRQASAVAALQRLVAEGAFVRECPEVTRGR